MSLDWIPVCKRLARKREVVRISSATGRTRQEVVGWLIEFWGWVDDETENGVIDGLHALDLVETVGADAAFWNAVQEVGWLTDAVSSLQIPNFDRWLGRSAKRRLKDRERKRSANVPQTFRKPSASQADKKRTTGQDKTRQDSITLPPFPPVLDTPEFRAAWEEWLAWRRTEKKKPVTPRAARLQLAELASFGLADAVEALRQSMRNDWTGLFRPRRESPGKDIFSGVKEFVARGNSGEVPSDQD